MNNRNQDSTAKKQEGMILIVDDVPKNLQLLGQALRSEGYDVAAVSSGEQALASAQKYEPDLILLDVMMPGKNGFEVCEELKADPDLEAIPVIFLTALIEQEDIIKGLELGGADYITKPFNTQELFARVKTHLALKQSRDEIERQNRELQTLSATKDRIYSVIGHDLRNSVGVITGVSDILLLNFDEKQQPNINELKMYLELIQQSSHGLGNLLKDLLSWARLQTNDMKVEKSPYSPVKAVKKTIELLKPVAKKKEISITFTPEEVPEIEGDERAITTITRNLLSNAIKFSHPQSTIEVVLNREADNLLISVNDKGQGMSEEVKSNLFNSEAHPRKRGTGNEKGAGFGLLLCNQLASLNGGEIVVESELGRGSTFTLQIPIELNEVLAG